MSDKKPIKNLEEVLHLYLPFEVEHLGSISKIIGIVPGDAGYVTFYTRYGFFVGSFETHKPILRRIEDMSEEEEFEWSENGHKETDPMMAEAQATLYLLSKHFDLFNLIPEGLAIDANTL